MNLYASTATPGHRWKLFLPTATMAERHSVATSLTVSSLFRSRRIERAALLVAVTDSDPARMIDSSRVIQNSAHTPKIFADSAATLWSDIAGWVETKMVQILFTIVATMTLGVLLALALCSVLLSIKEDFSQRPLLAQNNATHDDSKSLLDGYEDAT